MTFFTYQDRLNLQQVLNLVRALTQTGDELMATLDDVLAAVAAMEAEVAVASDSLKELAAHAADPAKVQDAADRLTAAHDSLKAAVDAVMASSGPVEPAAA